MVWRKMERYWRGKGGARRGGQRRGSQRRQPRCGPYQIARSNRRVPSRASSCRRCLSGSGWEAIFGGGCRRSCRRPTCCRNLLPIVFFFFFLCDKNQDLKLPLLLS
ncbi:hypothetical protein ACOSQ4_012396 [Xanthoceras sorbifolium]